MIYKILIVASLILISCKPAKKEPLVLLDCIPQNTVAAFQLKDQNMLKNTITNFPFLEALGKINDSLYEDIKALLPNQFPSNTIFFLTLEGKESLASSLIFSSNSLDTLPKNIVGKYKYNEVEIDIEQVENQKVFNAKIQNINIYSSSKLVLENSIRNIKNKKRGIQDNSFYKLAGLSDDNAPLSIYLHHDFVVFLKDFFPETDLFPYMGNSWFYFDFNTKKNPFTLDGVSFINDSIPDELSFLKGLKSKKLASSKYIPQNFDSYLALSISDYKTLEDNFKKYSRYKNTPLNQIKFDLLSTVDEIALLRYNSNQAVYLHLKNEENIPKGLFSNTGSKYNFRGISIKDQSLPEDFLSFLNSFGEPFNPSQVAKVDDFLIYTSKKAFLKQLIGAKLDGNTLHKDFNFKSLLEDLADNSSYLWVGNTSNLKNKWKKNSSKKMAWDNIKLNKYPLIVTQGISENNFVQSRFTFQKNNPKQEKNSVINQYSFSLDAPLSRKPQWIKNHRNKTMDIVVQDLNNVMYLFSNTGTLFWKKQLTGQIVGEIRQVDLYKNRRLQMAFRTADRFMILDRNGKIVPPFDKKIPSEKPHHLAVFDYDLKRNYRFLLSHGKKIEMYDNRGKIVSGFKLKKLKKPLENPPKHIRFGNKDYIVLKDIEGQIQILNRQGKDRIQLKQSANSSSNDVFEYRNTFTTTTKDGNLLQIDTKGNLIKSLLGLRSGHRVDMTTKSLVTFSENKLVIKGIPVILPFGNYTSPKIHYINNIIYITITDIDSQKVYAFYSNGKPVGGFPVYGSSAVSLSNADNDKALEMVVQSEAEGMLIYQIN